MTKTKQKIFLVVLALVLVLSLSLVACKTTEATVTFKNGTDTVSTAKVEIGATLTAEQIPSAPTAPEGKEFDGWYNGTEKAEAGKTKISADTTFEAKFVDKQQPEPTKYTLKYAAGEGTGTAPAEEKYEAGATVTVKANMFTAPQNKEFDGWSDGTTKYTAAQTFAMPAKDVTLTAQWKAVEPQTYTVTYAAGAHGTGTAPAELSFAEGATVTLAARDLFTAEQGWEFAGWLVEGETDVRQAGDTISMPAKNITITAQWTSTVQLTPEAFVGIFDLVDESELDWLLTITENSSAAQGEVPLTVMLDEDEATELQLAVVEGKQQLTFTIAGIVSTSYTMTLEQDGSFTFVDDADMIYTVTKRTGGGEVTLTPEAFVGTFDVVEIYDEGTDNYVMEIALNGETLSVTFDGTEAANVVLAVVEGKQQLSFDVASGLVGSSTYLMTLESEDSFTFAIEDDTYTYTITKRTGGGEVTLTPEAFVGTFDVAESSDEGTDNYVMEIALNDETLSITFDGTEATNVTLAVVEGKQQLSFDITSGIGSMSFTTTYLMTLESDESFTFAIQDDETYTYTVTKRTGGGETTIPEKYQGVWIGSISFGGNDYDQFRIVGSKINLRDEYYGQYYDDEDVELTVESTDGNFVLSFAGSKYTATLTFTSDTACSLTVTTTGMFGITVTASFVKEIYVTLSFDMGEGYNGTPVAIESKQVVATLTTTAPEEPSWYGYRFLGWFADGATEAFDFANTAITEDTTLTAHWEKIETVTVTFVAAEFDTVIQTLNFADKATAPEGNYEKDGYLFGWYAENATTAFDFANTEITDNITLTGKWLKYCTVTYVYPDSLGITAPAATQVTEGTKITLATCPVELTGYQFAGWSISAITNGQLKAEEVNYTVIQDINLTPIYSRTYTCLTEEENKPVTLKITLRTDGYAVYEGYYYHYTETPFTDTISTVSIPEAYMWIRINNSNLKFDYTDQLELFPFTANDGTTVLKFDGVDGALLGTTLGSYAWNQEGTAITLTFEEQNYTLKLAVESNAYVISGSTTITVSGTDYVFGTPVVDYTVTYELGEGIQGTAPEAQVVKSDDNVITLPVLTGVVNEGFRFAGWTVKGGDATKVLKGSYTVEGDVTLVAAWTENVGGGEEEIKPLSYFVGETSSTAIMYGFSSAEAAVDNAIKTANSSGEERTFYQAKVYKNYSGKLLITIQANTGSVSNPKDESGNDITNLEVTNQVVIITSASYPASSFRITFAVQNGKRTITIVYGDQTVTWTEIETQPAA